MVVYCPSAAIACIIAANPFPVFLLLLIFNQRHGYLITLHELLLTSYGMEFTLAGGVRVCVLALLCACVCAVCVLHSSVICRIINMCITPIYQCFI